MRTGRVAGWLINAVLGVMTTQAALAAPLDLLDPTPRRVEVRFEISPAHTPGQLDGTWSVARVAYLESEAEGSTIRIRIPADEIEAHLRTTGRETVPGSFSEFVWTLDPRTGHVLEAALSGHVVERFSLGPIRTSALVEIHVEMSTTELGGFRRSRGLLGLSMNRYCSPLPESSDCVAVQPVRFDPESGYVNAVGFVTAAASIAWIRAFSPLGEVQFSERAGRDVETVISGSSAADGLCSPEHDGPCVADLGGES